LPTQIRSEARHTRVLQPSRPKLQAGDIFAIGLADGGHLFGRVILADVALPHAPMPGSNLIYIYRQVSADPTPDLRLLTPNNLLLPPTWTNRLGWTKGYYQTVARLPLEKQDRLRTHCFDGRDRRPRYLDERGEPLMFRREPCGEWGLAGYLFIDEEIGRALARA
jgi:hypothetical protein